MYDTVDGTRAAGTNNLRGAHHDVRSLPVALARLMKQEAKGTPRMALLGRHYMSLPHEERCKCLEELAL